MLTRRHFLSAAGAAPLAAQTARPNFVFVLVDDLRWDALGCTGHPFARTPNIDRLAHEGARFTNAFVTTPLCSPARASFLTGQYVRRHGVKGNTQAGNEISHRLVTFPRLLHDAGYATGYVGKWHMGNDDSPRPGFDRWVSFKGQGRYDNPPLNIDGKQVQTTGYMTDILGQHAAEFVSQKHGKPFCLYVGHKAIHGPFTPSDRYKNAYSNDPLRRAASHDDPLTDKPAMLRKVVGDNPAVHPAGGPRDELIRNQLRCMNSVDDSVGVMMKALEDSGQADNTVFVFTSDNGYFWGEHGLGDKRWAFEEALRIPLLVRWPRGVKAGSVIAQDALNIDIAPTFLDLGGAPVPANVQGRSLAPLIQGKKPKWRDSFLAEYFQEQNYPRTPTWEAIRTPQWKYVRYTDLDGMDELYDLKHDSAEMTNRISHSSAAAQLAKLKKSLTAFPQA